MHRPFARHKNELVLACIFLALFVVFSLSSANFFSVTNVMNLFSQMSTLGLLTLGMAASMISGGMDLSVGALCSLSTVLCATFIGVKGMDIALSVLLVFALALLCGLFNGILIGYCKIDAMLVTLGTQSLFTGIGLVISKGITVSIPTDRFGLFGRYRLFGVIPFQILLLFFAIAVSILLFNFRIAGRRIYLIGSNREVARFAGINIPRNIVFTYVFSAAMAFLAALVMASRVSSGRADVAAAQVLKSVSAAVFGGVSTLGGIGTLGGAMLGVAVITLISNGMDMMNLSTYLQQISTGAILLVVLAFRHMRRK
ncbi:MAG: ABC transporter permease [Clostridiales bacterium]|nr:ABC transporter permease [Clostridiales bacterium]